MNLDILYASLAVFIGELYGSFVWGGSIVTQLVLQEVVWLNVRYSIALDNAAVIGSAIGLLWMLLYQGYRAEKWMYPMILISTLWALFWAKMLGILPLESVKIIFTLSVVFLVVKNIFFTQNIDEASSPRKAFFLRVKDLLKFKEKSAEKMSVKTFLFLSFAFIFITSYNAFLSIGNFAVAMLILTAVFRFPYHYALFCFAFITIIPRGAWTIEYFQSWLLEWNFYIPMLISSLIAWALAGYIVEKLDSKLLEKFLKYLTLAMALYLVLQLFS